MSDATSSPAQVLAHHGRRPEPFRDGVLHMQELPLADDRTAASQRSDTDLLGELGTDTSEQALTDAEILGLSFLFVTVGLDSVTSALSNALAAALPPAACTSVCWPAPPVGTDKLLLIFPPGGGEVGRD